MGSSLTIALSAVDPEGQPLTWSYVTTPAGQLTGSLSGGAPTLTYTAPANPQVDSFIYEVSDGALTAQGTIVITVTRANVAPVAVNDVEPPRRRRPARSTCWRTTPMPTTTRWQFQCNQRRPRPGFMHIGDMHVHPGARVLRDRFLHLHDL